MTNNPGARRVKKQLDNLDPGRNEFLRGKVKFPPDKFSDPHSPYLLGNPTPSSSSEMCVLTSKIDINFYS